MEKENSMIDHVNKLKTIAEHLEALDDIVAEKDLVMILISSLPDEYNNLITTLETLKEEKLTWDYVRDRVISEYDRKNGEKKGKKEKEVQNALLVSGRNQNKKFYKNGNGNQSTTRFKCHHCQEKGHFIKDCP